VSSLIGGYGHARSRDEVRRDDIAHADQAGRERDLLLVVESIVQMLA